MPAGDEADVGPLHCGVEIVGQQDAPASEHGLRRELRAQCGIRDAMLHAAHDPQLQPFQNARPAREEQYSRLAYGVVRCAQRALPTWMTGQMPPTASACSSRTKSCSPARFIRIETPRPYSRCRSLRHRAFGHAQSCGVVCHQDFLFAGVRARHTLAKLCTYSNALWYMRVSTNFATVRCLLICTATQSAGAGPQKPGLSGFARHEDRRSLMHC
jgi:hypothetical protein